MYMLSLEQKSRVVQALCEGNSVRATCRLTGAAKGTVLRLLAQVGTACQAFHDHHVDREVGNLLRALGYRRFALHRNSASARRYTTPTRIVAIPTRNHRAFAVVME
jgi:hypothetical protein